MALLQKKVEHHDLQQAGNTSEFDAPASSTPDEVLSHPHKRSATESASSDSSHKLKIHRNRKTASMWDFVAQDIQTICCLRSCIGNFTINQIIAHRDEYNNMNPQAQTNWIRMRHKTAYANKEVIFVVDQNYCCFTAFKRIFGISDYKYSMATTSQELAVHGNKGKARQRAHTGFAKAWLLDFFAANCDEDPMRGKQYLPPSLDREAVAALCIQHIFSELQLTVSVNTIRSIWANNFPLVRCSKKIRMGRCDDCLQLSQEKKTLSKDQYTVRKAEHEMLHTKSREQLSQWQMEAMQNPTQIAYFGFDGKQGAHFPHVRPLPKRQQTTPKIKIQVTGSLCITQLPKLHYYLAMPHWEFGPNYCLTLLYDMFLRFMSQSQDQRPRVLYFNIDNCAREGKCQLTC